MSKKHLKKQYWIDTSDIGHIYINDGGNHMSWQGVVDTLNALSDENKQLKKENEYLHKYNTKLQKQPLLFDVQTIPDTMEILEANSKLEEENEQLKKELKRCRDWLNSDKYDYELTLGFIKNKGYSLKDVLEYEKELKE